MTIMQAFFFGIMVAWTPSRVFLAWMLARGSKERSSRSPQALPVAGAQSSPTSHTKHSLPAASDVDFPGFRRRLR